MSRRAVRLLEEQLRNQAAQQQDEDSENDDMMAYSAKAKKSKAKTKAKSQTRILPLEQDGSPMKVDDGRVVENEINDAGSLETKTVARPNVFALLNQGMDNDENQTVDENESETTPSEEMIDSPKQSKKRTGSKTTVKKAKQRSKEKEKRKSKTNSDDLEALARLIDQGGLDDYPAQECTVKHYMTKDELADPEFVRLATELYEQILELSGASKPLIANQVGDFSTNSPVSSRTLLSLPIDPNKLSADYELKRMFGAQAVQMAGYGRASNVNAGPQGRRIKTGKHSCILVHPRDGWPYQASGLAMVLDVDALGRTGQISYFRFERSGLYKQVHEQYRMVVESMDPNALAEFVSRFPTHAESLLQMSEVYRLMGELDRSAEFVERALYVLECHWSAMFKPMSGQSRMSYDVIENRAMFIGLFRFQQLVVRKGLRRTGFEVCKLLLNLEPVKDPMGILLILDSYALGCSEYQFIVDLYDRFQPIDVRMLPNFAFSHALARYRIKRVEKPEKPGSSRSVSRSLAGSADPNSSQMLPDDEIDTLMVNVMLAFPMFVTLMLKQVSDHMDSSIVRLIESSALFRLDPYEDQVRVLQLQTFAKIYAKLSKHGWTLHDENVAWFARCAQQAIALASSNDARYQEAMSVQTKAFDYLQARSLYRQIRSSDFLEEGSVLNADVFLDNHEVARGQRGQTPTVVLDDNTITGGRMLVQFLHSLMPWTTVESIRDEFQRARTDPTHQSDLWSEIQGAFTNYFLPNPSTEDGVEENGHNTEDNEQEPQDEPTE